MLSPRLIWSALESAPDAIVICDAPGRILFVNRQVTALFGYEEQEIRARSNERPRMEHLSGPARTRNERCLQEGLLATTSRIEDSVMAIRLEQMHPVLVHLPIALLPLALGADLLGAVTGKRSFLTVGRAAIAAGAVGAVASAATGLIAGEEVNVEGTSRDKLMTHRNLNALVTLVGSCMAIWRARHAKPNAAYLGIGSMGMGVLAYTAYLGGKLVYESGAGVAPAHGVYRPDAPTLRADRMDGFARAAVTDLVHGAQHMAREFRQGYSVPAIIGKHSMEIEQRPQDGPGG